MNYTRVMIAAMMCMAIGGMNAKKRLPVPKKPVARIAVATPPAVSVAQVAPQPRVTVINNITPEMTTYPHWTKDYTPTTFEISVNGETLNPLEQKEIVVKDNAPLKVSYKYSFLNGYRTGEKEESFTVSPDITEPISLEFSWKSSPEHVSLKRITPVNHVAHVKEIVQ